MHTSTMNDGIVMMYSAVFLLYSAMEVLGVMPQELKSAGLTLPALLHSYYGDQSDDFMLYNLRRTTAAVFLHTLLPLLFCFGLALIQPSTYHPVKGHSFGLLLWLLAVSIAICGVTIATIWCRSGWRRHPLMRQLSKTGQPVRSVVQSVNLEFRDVDKFIAELGGSAVVVTDSWILQTNVHSVDIIHQRDAVLHVSSSDHHSLTLEGQSAQFLTILVQSINRKFRSFKMRLNSLQYSQLTERLTAPVRVARDVLIHQSLGDRFSAAFRDQPLEPCVGCLQAQPEVKLSKQCDQNQCRHCFCRPMWCLGCMSKWFAARQDQHRPESWMQGSAPCPMCRAPFCMLDVLSIPPDL